MNAPPFSYTLLFLRGEWGTVSTVSSLPARLLSLWYQSFPISRRHWPDASWVLRSEKSPSWRADATVEHSVGIESLPLTSFPKLLYSVYLSFLIGKISIIGWFVRSDQFLQGWVIREMSDITGSQQV